ncbi:hypothetical protein E4T44_00016 [Aureobasidium sp. EXF-8845]|nr:hypothetical protein E4T44_00016 [Aureobasidium sp. EXF-8845]KAI4858457.1 hypothetical protein E4T45_00033 [Aureobasidium sp. EXF-8846]
MTIALLTSAAYTSAEYKADMSHRQTEQTPSNLVVLPSSSYLFSNLSAIRDVKTPGPDLTRAFKRVATQIIARACDYIPVESFKGITPTQSPFEGVSQTTKVCGISILRAGASFEEPLREAYRYARLSFSIEPFLTRVQWSAKLWEDSDTERRRNVFAETFILQVSAQATRTGYVVVVAQPAVLILEPILATGGSICTAIDLILRQGVSEHNIIIANLITSRKALEVVFSKYPSIRIVTAAVDEKLNAKW